MEEQKEKKKVIRNSELFGEWLSSRGLSYRDVFYHLNENGITEFNDVIKKSGVLVQNDKSEYLGEKDFYGADNGMRTSAEKALDCVIGNIQEKLFCMDNHDFKPNEDATNKNTLKDSDITTKKLDLIHIPTNNEVEFKVSYCKEISDYDTAIYRHRDGHFQDFMRNNNIIIIYFPYLDKAAVFDKSNFKDSENGKNKGAVSIINTKVDENGKTWDIVSVWSGLFYDYKMMKVGDSGISKKVSKIIKGRC